MEPKDLLKVWDAPDHSKLTPKQISLRLPIQVSAKISALCDMYPRKTKTEIIGDLLATALDQFEANLPSELGRFDCYHPEDDTYYYEETGPAARFRVLYRTYLNALEEELGMEPSCDPNRTVLIGGPEPKSK